MTNFTRVFTMFVSTILTIQISAAENTLFTPEDVFDLEYASDPRVSPDGRSVVYVRRSNDIMTDKTRSSLWQVDAQGNNHRPLVSDTNNHSSPRWSADGTRLAYISSASASTQVHVRWLDTGQTALLTNLRNSPKHISWSPDGRRIAFTMSVKGKTRILAKARKKPKGASWAEPVKVIETIPYQFDGNGIVEPEYEQIFVIPEEGGTPRQITNGEFNHGGPLEWDRNSRNILFSSNRHQNWPLESGERDIFSVNVKSRNLSQLTNSEGAEFNPRFSKDNNHIAYLAVPKKPVAYQNTQLKLMKRDGSESRLLSGSLDASLSNLFWSRTQNMIYAQFDQRAVRKIATFDLKGLKKIVVEGLSGTSLGRPYLSGTYHLGGNDTIAFTSGKHDSPADIVVMKKDSDKQVLATQLNTDLLADKNLASIHNITYASSFDGEEIQGWYLLPPDFDPEKKYPLILEIHGGPHLAYGPYFSAELQLMAAAGYVVFYDNHRGSSSYGERFALLLQYKYSSKEDFADHMSGVDAVISKGFVDEDNLFIAGGSAGGIATAYAIGLTDRFNAAAAAKPVINWISKTLTADSSVGQIYHQFPGPPWEHFQHYWERSPLSLVGQVTTPTLLLTGEADRRTPISETEQFYQALKLRKIDAAMVRVPDSPHGIAGRPSRLIAKVDNILAWFERYRKD